MVKTISVYFSEEDRQILRTASKLSGISQSSFIKQFAMQQAHLVLKKMEANT